MDKFSLKNNIILLLLWLLLTSISAEAQQFSKARVWNEIVLNGIRNDFARPTVHARNLFHTSLAMYDAFAAYDDVNETYLLGKTIGEFTCEFDGVSFYGDIQDAREMAMSYAVYRIMELRFKDSPGAEDIMFNADLVFSASGYDKNYTDTDYTNGFPAALGNYIAEQVIAYGLQDGSNEINEYANQYYKPVNPEMNPFWPFYDPLANFGNPRLNDPNRWQKLDIPGFVDQSGNVVEGGSPDFLSPEWGRVTPFALTENELSILERDGEEWWVYHDPGPPAYLDTLVGGGLTDGFKWGFTMPVVWKTHTILDTFKKVDISPGAIGNMTEFPTTIEGLRDYYNFEEGGDTSPGHDLNPVTGLPYEPQIVIQGDYTRLVAEWWADGPSSETPPGHWFNILNYVNDQDALVKKYKGEGEELGNLEWDVKAYFMLGGAMHDSAISAWSIKGYYDYIRPISAIRYMVDKGQCTDPNGINYDPNGIPLIPGIIEQILEGDPLLSYNGSNLGNIKILSNRTFQGLEFYSRGEYWLPYQDVTFVTPPFAGYVSGHSTYSRAAAEVLSMFTGDDFFPGGLGEVHFEEGEFNITNGPYRALSLQWATYRDAANQSGLSRIWGGIHPPVDDIPGRQIGEKIGIAAFDLADELFGEGLATSSPEIVTIDNDIVLFPNPIFANGELNISSKILTSKNSIVRIYDNQNKIVYTKNITDNNSKVKLNLSHANLSDGIYHLNITDKHQSVSKKLVLLK